MAFLEQSFAKYSAWAAPHFPPGQAAIAVCLPLLDQAAQIFAHITAARPLPFYLPADLRFANVIERPDGRLAYVDWEDSGLRDPARDLGRSIDSS
ncbi:MAG: hypothetical protein R2932_23705 [Caldilineaceae bacterium]